MDDTFNSVESLRLQALKSYVVLDTPAEQAYDDVVCLAALICGVPIALISLVDEDRQWFKAKVGVDVMETPRGRAFCAQAILDPEQITEVRDASLDSRFASHPLVTGDPNIRFYAGAPLLTPSGSALGTVCVMDRVPRTLTPAMADALKALSRHAFDLAVFGDVGDDPGRGECRHLHRGQRLAQLAKHVRLVAAEGFGFADLILVFFNQLAYRVGLAHGHDASA